MEIVDRFSDDRHISNLRSSSRSPSGKYTLTITFYSQGAGYWNYSRGIVTETETGNVVADVKRNYGSFWHFWVAHADGKEYLLCGEDYQGYNIISFNHGGNDAFVAPVTHRFKTPAGEWRKMQTGWCWIGVEGYDPATNELRVHGCYWGCEPGEIKTFDFSNPHNLPLPVLKIQDYYDVYPKPEGD